VFSALERLVDEAAARPAPQPAVRPPPPQASTGKAPPAAAGAHADDYEVLPERHLSAEQHAILFTAPGSSEAPAARESGPYISAQALNAVSDSAEVPVQLAEDLRALRGAKRARSRRGAWLIACIALALLLAAQLAWRYREAWLAEYPQWRSSLAALCARVGCDATAPSDPARIELLSRDVRDHPQYRDVLLVNATIVNRSARALSYPIIELGLFDRGGRVSGVRRFEPREYLDASIDATAGMPPARPIVVVLEVVAPSDDAVSFEFRFL
jgi:hypothetical protein